MAPGRATKAVGAIFYEKKYLQYLLNCDNMLHVCVGNSVHDKSRIPITDRVPEKTVLRNRVLSGLYAIRSMRKNLTIGGKKHERYFYEAVIRSWCTFWSSDKKMEP